MDQDRMECFRNDWWEALLGSLLIRVSENVTFLLKGRVWIKIHIQMNYWKLVLINSNSKIMTELSINSKGVIFFVHHSQSYISILIQAVKFLKAKKWKAGRFQIIWSIWRNTYFRLVSVRSVLWRWFAAAVVEL